VSTGTVVTLSEYLATSYRPDCEYLDGELLERNVGEWDHSRLQMLLSRYLVALLRSPKKNGGHSEESARLFLIRGNRQLSAGPSRKNFLHSLGRSKVPKGCRAGCYVMGYVQGLAKCVGVGLGGTLDGLAVTPAECNHQGDAARRLQYQAVALF
jgi:hypothetical protein